MVEILPGTRFSAEEHRARVDGRATTRHLQGIMERSAGHSAGSAGQSVGSAGQSAGSAGSAGHYRAPSSRLPRTPGSSSSNV